MRTWKWKKSANLVNTFRYESRPVTLFNTGMQEKLQLMSKYLGEDTLQDFLVNPEAREIIKSIIVYQISLSPLFRKQ